ncbi:hypothetical protein V6N11_016017 [Hibiscus sabdariffa]|uniref:GAG-pre-integrase domain-containing protein n=1 Tax=Hibiscus sabdariffa TaxID=183260 RepID=A0ABR2TU73_9ROSI
MVCDSCLAAKKVSGGHRFIPHAEETQNATLHNMKKSNMLWIGLATTNATLHFLALNFGLRKASLLLYEMQNQNHVTSPPACTINVVIRFAATDYFNYHLLLDRL